MNKNKIINISAVSIGLVLISIFISTTLYRQFNCLEKIAPETINTSIDDQELEYSFGVSNSYWDSCPNTELSFSKLANAKAIKVITYETKEQEDVLKEATINPDETFNIESATSVNFKVIPEDKTKDSSAQVTFTTPEK